MRARVQDQRLLHQHHDAEGAGGALSVRNTHAQHSARCMNTRHARTHRPLATHTDDTFGTAAWGRKPCIIALLSPTQTQARARMALSCRFLGLTATRAPCVHARRMIITRSTRYPLDDANAFENKLTNVERRRKTPAFRSRARTHLPAPTGSPALTRGPSAWLRSHGRNRARPFCFCALLCVSAGLTAASSCCCWWCVLVRSVRAEARH